jgi:hypothetical protein
MRFGRFLKGKVKNLPKIKEGRLVLIRIKEKPTEEVNVR